MTRNLLIPILAVLTTVLVACSSPSATSPVTNISAPSSNLARTDTQGSVEFAVTPLDLTAPSDTIDFTVALNTHSVDLSWDLAAKSDLMTDTGLTVKGLSWPVGSGHHYEGRLTFPAKTGDGQPLLTGAKKLTLTIRDAGASERKFEWEISK